MREDVYAAVKAFNASEEAKGLKGEAARYLRFSLRDARRAGLELPKAKRDELGGLLKEVSKVG
jgi:Zn-dependent oligopeptidase